MQGSNWDPDSVMHYPFEPDLIREPAAYRTGLQPAGGLSPRDITWVKTFYPPLNVANDDVLEVLKTVSLSLSAGQQRNFTFKPKRTRKYEMRTFGSADTVMVLFEEVDGQLRQLAADDDSGEDRNAYFKAKLFRDRKYTLRLRLYYADDQRETAVMVW